VAAIWIREAVRGGDSAEEKIRELSEPIQPVARISVDLGECYFTRRPRRPAPPGPGEKIEARSCSDNQDLASSPYSAYSEVRGSYIIN